jgi:hypothetical protein
MEETKALDRRQFTLAAALAALSGVAITITACGSGGGYPTSSSGSGTGSSGGGTGSGSNGDKVGQISNNHGHTAVITGAQLSAGGALDLDIRGTATHAHHVSLAGGDVTSIAAGQKISKESTSDDGHSHTVTFN